MKSARLLPMRKRLELLQDGLTEVAGELRCQAGVPVFLVARCGHPECGLGAGGPDLPDDALVVELGCSHEVPQIEAPTDTAAGRLRAERHTHADAVGRGLPEARQRALLKTIRML